MQNYVFQIDANQLALDMIHPARARKIQHKGKAASFRVYPYTVVHHNVYGTVNTKSYTLKIDPGSKYTGFAIQCGDEVVYRMELKHRGSTIKADLLSRAGMRRSRRSRLCRYRKKRFNRTKPKGWLAPSLMHRVRTVETWIKRFIRYCPITLIEIEQVRFDLQQMENGDISGVEYQQGTLAGYEIREYLLEKWDRKCAYCGAKNLPLQVEHIHPKSKGGSDRASNLCLACERCNQAKGTQDIKDFLRGEPDILKRIQAQQKRPLADAAAVNATRFKIVEMAKTSGLPVKCWTGGRTKHNRIANGYEKGHSIDAACVGKSGLGVKILPDKPLLVDCKGHGNRQARRVNSSGFPAVKNAKKTYKHCATGDMVRVTLRHDRKNVEAGTYTCRVKTPTDKGLEVLIGGKRVGLSNMQGVEFIHRNDGYSYTT
jgi:hypothetical protein